jgi:hypothetical protein
VSRIDLTKAPPTLFRTSFIYGAYGSGKTDFCATYPRVAWFGSAREGGAETMRWMDRSRWYDPNIAPHVYAVENPAEMFLHLNRDVMPLVQKGVIKTIVLELSFYSDDMIRSMPTETDGWTKYGDLEKHIMNMDERWKKIPGLRIVYNALAQVEPDDKKPAGPLLAGKALAKKLPAICDAIGYLRTEVVDGGIDRILHFQSYANFPARHRYGARLPAFVRNPTYRQIEALINQRATCDANGVVTLNEAPRLTGLPPIKGAP